VHPKGRQVADWREGRRIRAWELKKEGWKQRDIAQALGVSAGASATSQKRPERGRGESAPSAANRDKTAPKKLRKNSGFCILSFIACMAATYAASGCAARPRLTETA